MSGAASRRGSAVMGASAILAGLVLSNLGNFAFVVAAQRRLGTHVYGTVAAVLAVTMLVQIPAGAVQLGISRRIAEIPASAAGEGVWLARKAAFWSLWVGLGVAVLAGGGVLVWAPGLPAGVAVAMALCVAPIVVLVLATGVLQGHQRFTPMSVSTALLGLPRLPAFLLFALVVAGVTAAVAASAVATLAAMLVALVAAFPRHAPPPVPAPERWRAFHRTILPLSVGLTGFASLMYLDVTIEGAVFSPHVAGLFGAAAAFGKAAVILPQAAAWVLAPRVSAAHADGRPTGRLLAGGLAVTVATGVVVALALRVVGTPLLVLVAGEAYRGGGWLLAPFVLTTTLTGVLLLLMNHQLARHDDRFAWVVAALAVLEAAGFVLGPHHPGALLWVETVVTVLGIAVYEALYGRSESGLLRSLRRPPV